MHMQKARANKSKVNYKEQLIEQKTHNVEEEKAARAAELRIQNEIKIKQALTKEEIIRQQKHNKDIEKVQAIEGQVKHFQLIKDKSETERQIKKDEHEMFRKAIIDRAKQFERETVSQKHESLESKIKLSEVRVREYHSYVDNAI